MLKESDPYAFANSNEMGDVVDPGDQIVPVDIWRRVLDLNTKLPTGMLKRERFRTRREVYNDLDKHLDIWFCPACGWDGPKRKQNVNELKCKKCGEDCTWYIDEYFSITGIERTESTPCGPFNGIAVFAVTGGSEGHYVHVGAYTEKVLYRKKAQGEYDAEHKDFIADSYLVYKDWFLIKTFRGAAHAYHQAARVAKLLDVCS